jgi:hypothetical protein
MTKSILVISTLAGTIIGVWFFALPYITFPIHRLHYLIYVVKLGKLIRFAQNQKSKLQL